VSSSFREAYQVFTEATAFRRCVTTLPHLDSGTTWKIPAKGKAALMTEYIVGLRHGKRSEVLTIEAEDALIAALKVKHNHPEALISYVRKSNRRGDRRNPHRKE
jgi:hypothetical protein